MKRKIILTLALSMMLLFDTATVFKINAVEAAESTLSQENQYVDYEELKQELKNEAQALISNDTTSIQYAICQGNNIIISDSVGLKNKSTNEQTTNATMYGIGSISKIYTAASVMKLADEGKIDINLPVNKYIRDFKMKDERYKKITVRMLLNHSAGFITTTQGDVSLRGENDRSGYDRFLKDLSEQNLKWEPGEVAAYSNDCFTLAQLLVERVSGMNFNEFVKKNFTDPLGFINTKTPLDDFDQNKLAKSYSPTTGNERVTENFLDIGMGGMYSTAEENCKFINAITNEDSGILSKQSIEAMKEKEYLMGVWPTDAQNNIVGFGLGWDTVNLFPFNRYGITALSKAGETLDYTSYVISIPEYNISVTIIASGGSSANNQYFAINSALKVLMKKGVVKQILPELKFDNEKSQYMPQYLINYSGKYLTQYGYYNVDIQKDGTLTYYENSSKIELHHTYSDYFVSDSGLIGIKFIKDKNGETYMERRICIPASDCYQFCSYEYIAQKIDENKLSNEVEDAWKNRANKLYLVADETPSSQFYEYGLGLMIGEQSMGYINGSKIINENESRSVLKLPGFNGGEGYEYSFYKEDGIEYVKHGGIVYMSQDGVNILNGDINSVTIGDNGYTKWYRVPDEFDGKVLFSNIPDRSNIVVFNSYGTCINNFKNYRQDHATLQKGDYIGFVGDSGTKIDFKVQ